MEAVLVVARHPHVPTTGPCGVEQAQELGPEPARSGGLPHASDALGSGGVAETQQQRCCVATSGQGLKPSNNAHKVGLHRVVGISPNVGRMAAVIDDHATYRVGSLGTIVVGVTRGGRRVSINNCRAKNRRKMLRRSRLDSRDFL